eukprot:6162063-Prymnesium_polylepis.1
MLRVRICGVEQPKELGRKGRLLRRQLRTECHGAADAPNARRRAGRKLVPHAREARILRQRRQRRIVRVAEQGVELMRQRSQHMWSALRAPPTQLRC